MMISSGACGEIRLKGKLSDLYDSPPQNNNNLPHSDRRILPKRGDIAVIVEGDDRQHIAIAEVMIINELINRGYKVVDEAKMKRIKMAAAKAKAAQYAWEGNIEGLLKLNGNYSVSATVLELNNSVGINRFSDWETSKDARELRIVKKLEYPITAPEL